MIIRPLGDVLLGEMRCMRRITETTEEGRESTNKGTGGRIREALLRKTSLHAHADQLSDTLCRKMELRTCHIESGFCAVMRYPTIN